MFAMYVFGLTYRFDPENLLLLMFVIGSTVQ